MEGLTGVKLSHRTSARLAEIAFLLIMIAGIWLAVQFSDPEKWHTFRTTAAGVLIAIAGLLLIVATHWGQFGRPDRWGEEQPSAAATGPAAPEQ